MLLNMQRNMKLSLGAISLLSSSVTAAPPSAFRTTKFGTRRKAYTSISSRIIASSSLSSSLCAFSHNLASRLDGLDKSTVWHEFTPLSNQYKSINLGQGFPDWNPPDFAIEAMMRSVSVDTDKGGRNANQYTRSPAHLPLASVLAKIYQEKYAGSRDFIDPETEVATAVGCTNALYCCLQGLLNEGDEVLLLEPAFDIYPAQVRMAGGVPKYVPLRTSTSSSSTVAAGEEKSLNANDYFTLDFEEFERAISPKTKLFILNTPHNPTGKMFSMSEMEKIAEIVNRHPQLTVIADEVYEHIVFDKENSPHISFASLPGMYDRTLTLNSSGKTFSATGWKIGWGVGPPHLVKSISAVQQWTSFSIPTPNQDAIAQCLEIASSEPYMGFDNYYDWLAQEYLRKRDLLVDILKNSGNMDPVIPAGGFFIVADTESYDFPESFLYEKSNAAPIVIDEKSPQPRLPRDWALSRYLTKEIGVTTIPPSAFYDLENVHLAKNLLRFAFCKGDDTLLKAKEKFLQANVQERK